MWDSVYLLHRSRFFKAGIILLLQLLKGTQILKQNQTFNLKFDFGVFVFLGAWVGIHCNKLTNKNEYRPRVERVDTFFSRDYFALHSYVSFHFSA